MAIVVQAKMPRELLRAIRNAIDDGLVANWEYDGDGDFTYLEGPYKRQAWFSARSSTDRLTLNMIGRKDTHVSVGLYAIYHGRFVEMLLQHFDDNFDGVRVTASATPGDLIE
ncbi:hypothetical protein [Corallococcus sp. AB045]|uniref:hypothetical protein n=1 Tax=Corallococcus sp. AB045 TaxID=2316719 RepID=UPI0011C35D51|nr:hypothetical protein [Corallococcus sp. AB045]